MNPAVALNLGNNLQRLNAVYQGYVEALYWTDTGDNDSDIPTDSLMASEVQFGIMLECADFLAQCDSLGLLGRYDASGHTWAEFGHDFWLTRNGHGAGFWDRNLGDLGDELTELAKTWGSVGTYLGDDGQVWV